jgi:hypothetical protein
MNFILSMQLWQEVPPTDAIAGEIQAARQGSGGCPDFDMGCTLKSAIDRGPERFPPPG